MITADIFQKALDERREMSKELEAELDEARRQYKEQEEREFKERELEDSKYAVWNRFLNGAGKNGFTIDADKYWELKNSPCHVCECEPVVVDFKVYKNILASTDMRVSRIEKNLPFTEENTVPLCSACDSMSKKKPLFLAIVEKLPKDGQNMARMLAEKEGKPAARKYVLEMYRSRLKLEQEECWI